MSCRVTLSLQATETRLRPRNVTTRCAWWNPTTVTKVSERSSIHEKRRTSPTKLDSKPVFELSKTLTKSGLSVARSQAILEVLSTVVAPLATEDALDKVKKKLDNLDGKFNLLALYILIEAAIKPDSLFKQLLSAVIKYLESRAASLPSSDIHFYP